MNEVLIPEGFDRPQSEIPKEEKNRLFWAEKILDKYPKYRFRNAD